MEFWSVDELDDTDSLNEEIWGKSPTEQDHIQPYTDDWKVGDIGAQQAMRYPYRLPWVPDLVGRDWRSRDAVVIVGSAYGPFIGGDGRPHEIEPPDYARASSSKFMHLFVEKVVLTRRYYLKIAEFASAVLPSCRLLALVDLCRVAFIRRGGQRDSGGDRVATAAPMLFNKYVESGAAGDWLWRRLSNSEASSVVALGTVAEHGVLRLFERHLRMASIRDSENPTIRFAGKRDDARWPSRYAHASRKVQDRDCPGGPRFWQIQGHVGSRARAWRLAVVPHPTGARGQTGRYPAMALRSVYDSRSQD